jgi:hypothetical protein
MGGRARVQRTIRFPLIVPCQKAGAANTLRDGPHSHFRRKGQASVKKQEGSRESPSHGPPHEDLFDEFFEAPAAQHGQQPGFCVKSRRSS